VYTGGQAWRSEARRAPGTRLLLLLLLLLGLLLLLELLGVVVGCRCWLAGWVL
jgi:hypothetical protein